VQLVEVSQEAIEASLGEEVPELYVTLAKHFVLGMDITAIAEIFQVESSDVQEIEDEELFKRVKTLMAAKYAEQVADMDFSWDGIENSALKNLSAIVATNRDPELNLKIATAANNAKRRHRGNQAPLTDNSKGSRVQLKLTQRYVSKLQKGSVARSSGEELQEETREVEVRVNSGVNGKTTSPTLKQLTDVLGRPKDVDGQGTVTLEGIIENIVAESMDA
jgi:hypothetical protein